MTLFVFLKGHAQTNSTGNSGNQRTTIDLLQGTWVDVKDKADVFRVNKDSIYYLSGKKITRKSALYISTKCVVNKDELTKSLKSGSHLIVYVPEYDDMMCYEIEAITEGKLNLFYEGKTLIYTKQK